MSNTTELRYTIFTYLDALWRKRTLIITILLLTPVLALLLSRMSTKMYEASTSLAMFNSTPIFLKDVSSIPEPETRFSGIKAYATSPANLKKIAMQIGILKPDATEKEIQSFTKQLAKAITITLIEKNLVDIKLTYSNPKDMAAILNALSATFITEYLKPITASAESLSVLLEKESAEQERKLNASIEKLNQFKNAQNKELPEYEKVYTDQLKTLMTAITENEGLYKSTLDEKIRVEKYFINSTPEIASLDREIAANNIALNNIKQIYTENYPGLKAAEELGRNLRKQRETLYQKLMLDTKNNATAQNNTSSDPLDPEKSGTLTQAELKGYQATQQKLKTLSERIDNLKTKKNEIEIVLKNINQNENNMAVLAKAVSENQKQYDDLLKQYKLAKMATRLDYTNQFTPIKIVAAPIEPLFSTSTRPFSLFLLIAFIGGLMICAGLTILFELMDNTARKRHSLEALTGLSVLARAGKLNFS